MIRMRGRRGCIDACVLCLVLALLTLCLPWAEARAAAQIGDVLEEGGTTYPETYELYNDAGHHRFIDWVNVSNGLIKTGSNTAQQKVVRDCTSITNHSYDGQDYELVTKQHYIDIYDYNYLTMNNISHNIYMQYQMTWQCTPVSYNYPNYDPESYYTSTHTSRHITTNVPHTYQDGVCKYCNYVQDSYEFLYTEPPFSTEPYDDGSSSGELTEVTVSEYVPTETPTPSPSPSPTPAPTPRPKLSSVIATATPAADSPAATAAPTPDWKQYEQTQTDYNGYSVAVHDAPIDPSSMSEAARLLTDLTKTDPDASVLLYTDSGSMLLDGIRDGYVIYMDNRFTSDGTPSHMPRRRTMADFLKYLANEEGIVRQAVVFTPR